MKVYKSIQDFKPLQNAVVTSGTFDGVHLGHQQILKRLAEITKQQQGESVVITFFPHPRMVLANGEVQLLNTLQEKIDFLAAQGVGHLLVIPFTKEFSEQSSEAFIQHILVDCIGTKTLVIGYDHRFGKNREGSFEYLKNNAGKYGFLVEEIPRQEMDNITISSTKIRNALLEGKIETANELLGKPYSFSGKVVKGKQLGRTIGYPTANIEVEETSKLIPAYGVYAVRVWLSNKEHKTGMMNIGIRPTVDGQTRTIEVNIFDFDADIYGEILQIEMLKKIRDEQKFNGIEALKTQLALDKMAVLDQTY